MLALGSLKIDAGHKPPDPPAQTAMHLDLSVDECRYGSLSRGARLPLPAHPFGSFLALTHCNFFSACDETNQPTACVRSVFLTPANTITRHPTPPHLRQSLVPKTRNLKLRLTVSWLSSGRGQILITLSPLQRHGRGVP